MMLKDMRKKMEIKKLKIGIDIDDTIWKFHKKFFEFYNNKFGTKLDVNKYYLYSLEKLLNISQEEAFSLLDEFSFSEGSYEFELMEGVIESINELSQKYQIYFITARHEGLFETTFKKLKEYFDFDFEILFVFDKERKLIKEKLDYCLENNINIIIDDRLKTLNSCSEKGIKSILINQPWNKNEELGENIFRVNNWEEVLEKIESQSVSLIEELGGEK